MTEGNGTNGHVGPRVAGYRVICGCAVTIVGPGRCEVSYCPSHSLRFNDTAEMRRLKEVLDELNDQFSETERQLKAAKLKAAALKAIEPSEKFSPARRKPFAERPAPPAPALPPLSAVEIPSQMAAPIPDKELQAEISMLREAIKTALELKATKSFVILHQALKGEWLK